jgi:hypothetical protein
MENVYIYGDMLIVSGSPPVGSLLLLRQYMGILVTTLNVWGLSSVGNMRTYRSMMKYLVYNRLSKLAFEYKGEECRDTARPSGTWL